MDTKESYEFGGNASVHAKLNFEKCKLMSCESELKELEAKEMYDAN
jgi:hypothetical protein